MAIFAMIIQAASTVVGVGAVVLIFVFIQAGATAREYMVKCEQVAGRVYMSFKAVNAIIEYFLRKLVVPAVRNRAKTTTETEGAETFRLEEIAAATDNFAVVLGQGDSGNVYKGKLQDGRAVAVKRLKDGLRRAEDTLGMELSLLRLLRHDHIVRLVGSCADEEERILVYEHMDNGTLREHLNNNASSSWIARIHVLLGAASAIGHLHRHSPAVIHCNVTSSNILLDRSLIPRLSGFGAAVCGAQAVDVVHSTYGYADPDPEYHNTGRPKPATDVYSFGVVTLEVLTGKQPVVVATSTNTTTMLVSWALPSIQAGKLDDVLDRRPVSDPSTLQREALQLVADTAASCLCIHGDDRPAISHVMTNLEEALQLICNDDLFQ